MIDSPINGTPASIVVVGAGNRANKYLEYIVRNPDKAKLVAVVEKNPIRLQTIAEKFGLTPEQCFEDYEEFFKNPVKAEGALICTPENLHYEPTMMAIEAGYNVLLEKPIAQTLRECTNIRDAANRKGVGVVICHVLRYHPYFRKIKDIIDSGELGEIVSIHLRSSVGLDRSTHGFVRGIWNKEKKTNPTLLSKCCHDIDLMVWLTQKRCRHISSFGTLRWFRKENSPAGSAERCINCRIESKCPYSAVNLYRERHDWISNFDIPEGKTIDDVIEWQLAEGPYGRCVYHCDNDVVDHQVVSMEMENEITVSFTMDMFTYYGYREIHISLTHGEIDGDENILRVRKFRGCQERIYDFSNLSNEPFHAGADLNIMEAFVDILHKENPLSTVSKIEDSIESHRICFLAEASRKSHA